MGEGIHKELSGHIIGVAMAVLNELKPGLDEKLYERAMVIELRERGNEVEVQPSFPVYFRQQLIGTLLPDLIVNKAVIVDPKVVAGFNESHIAQMIGYLNITGLGVGIALEFQARASRLETRDTPATSRSASRLPRMISSSVKSA